MPDIALVLGASGAAALGFLPFPLPLESFGAWGCPLVVGIVVGAGIATGALCAASGGRMRFSGNSLFPVILLLFHIGMLFIISSSLPVWQFWFAF